MHEDVAYGFRLFDDVAQRSLSPAMGDPTTATQAIDRLHDCLRQLAPRPFPSGLRNDASGRLRLVVPFSRGEATSTSHSRSYATRRASRSRYYAACKRCLEDLLGVAPSKRRPPLERHRELFERRIQETFDHVDERGQH